LANVRAWLTGLKQQSREAILAAQRAAEPTWPADEFEPWVDSKLVFDMNFFNGLKAPAFEWSALLRDIRCPALLITADPALGAIITPAQAAELQALLPQVQVAQVAGAGHSIRRDQYQRYLAVLEPFLAEASQLD
jgi:pimeloyl-ACP methyl ester carboxylesterase